MTSRVFRTGRQGTAAVLGPLESEVLNVLWSMRRPASVGDVVAAFEAAGKSPAYSTIKTILNNLTSKGYAHKRAEGRANVFVPAQSKSDFEKTLVGDVVSGLLRDFRNPLIAHMVEEMATDPQGLAEFERLLAQRKQQRS